MSISRLSIFAFLILVVGFISCDSKNPYDTGPVYDYEGNLAKDSLLIVDYLKTAEIDSLYRIYDPSGVVIIVQEEGVGSRPKAGNIIYTNYTGSLFSDGSVFDTSIEQVAIENDIYDEKRIYEPLSFLLGSTTIVSGWNFAFLRLRSGSKAKIIIPAALGYQDKEIAKIPANSILIFDIEFKGMD